MMLDKTKVTTIHPPGTMNSSKNSVAKNISILLWAWQGVMKKDACQSDMAS